jgi:dynein intermediate chain 1, axonemal
VHVFDLSKNKHEPLCEQKVVKKSKLTHVSFNQQHHIVIVGDDRGGVTSLKLSPNLRRVDLERNAEGEPVPFKDPKDFENCQVEKMEKLLQAASN